MIKKHAETIINILTIAYFTKTDCAICAACQGSRFLPAAQERDAVVPQAAAVLGALQLPLVRRGAEDFFEIAREAGYRAEPALPRHQIHRAVAPVHHAAGLPDAHGVEIVEGVDNLI